MNKRTDSREIFESLPIGKALRLMAVPTVISQIIVLIYNLADTFFVGKTNNPYMVAATSLILPVFNITLSLASLTGTGAGSLISRLLGRNMREEAKKVSAFAVYLSIVITAVFSLSAGIFMKPMLVLLGAGDNTFLFAKQYAFCVIVLGGVPTVLSNVMSNLLRSAGFSRQAGIGITMGGLINIALDPLFMFAILPKGNEILGAGIATCLSNCIACVYFIIVIVKMKKKSCVITFSARLGMPEKKSVVSIFNVGFPAALATLLFDLDYIVVDRLMVAYGDIALAAVGIVLKAERLPLNVGIGICQGMMPIVAYNYSSKNYKRMNETVRYSRKVGLIFAAASIVLYELTAKYIITMFINDTETVALATDFLRIRILATPLMFLSFFTVYLFQAFGRGERSLFLGVMRWAAFNIPMLFILNAVIGQYGIVWSQSAADILTVALSLFVYGRYSKKFNSVAE